MLGNHKQNTFIVKLSRNGNSNWKGNVIIAETGQTKNFQGALELLRVIDSEVECQDMEEGKIKSKPYDKPIVKIWE